MQTETIIDSQEIEQFVVYVSYNDSIKLNRVLEIEYESVNAQHN